MERVHEKKDPVPSFYNSTRPKPLIICGIAFQGTGVGQKQEGLGGTPWFLGVTLKR